MTFTSPGSPLVVSIYQLHMFNSKTTALTIASTVTITSFLTITPFRNIACSLRNEFTAKIINSHKLSTPTKRWNKWTTKLHCAFSGQQPRHFRFSAVSMQLQARSDPHRNFILITDSWLIDFCCCCYVGLNKVILMQSTPRFSLINDSNTFFCEL